MAIELSAAADRVANVALEQFADKGYDAATLNDIAELAGIKKPSLYAHFSSKDDLYEKVLAIALQTECDFVSEHFSATAMKYTLPTELYLNNLRERFLTHSSLRFLMRAALYPPPAFEQQVAASVTECLHHIKRHIKKAISVHYPTISKAVTARMTEMYMAAIDSLCVVILHGNESAYTRRLDTLQKMSRAAL